MDLLFSGVFWGSLIVLFGISVILKSIFNIDIPVFKIAFGALFVYLGISILIGGFNSEKNNQAIFQEKNIKYQDSQKDYNVIFAKGNLDFTDLKVGKQGQQQEINVIFGSGDLAISSKAPIKIIASSAFGAVSLPSGQSSSFSTVEYTTKSFDAQSNHLVIKANAVFGNINIIEK